MHNTKKQGKRTRSPRKNNRNLAKGSGNHLVRHTIWRNPGQIVPEESLTTLTYITGGVLTSAGFQTANRRWYTNNPYDPDPLLGSAPTPGYVELGNLYYQSRAVAAKVRLQVSNNQSFGLTVYCGHSNVDTGSGSYLYGANPLWRSNMLAAAGSGGASRVINFPWVTMAQVVGSQAPETEDNFRGLTTGSTVPTDLTWFSLTVDSHVPSNTLTAGQGIYFEIQIKMRIRFYQRKLLNS